MADQTELLRLALIGARQRWIEIEEERERLLALFPELAKKPRGSIAKAAAEPVVLFDAHDEAHDEQPAAVPHGSNGADDRKARAIELMREGKTIPEVAKAIGVEKSWLYRVAEKAGVTPAPAPKGPTPKSAVQAKAGKRHVWTDEEMKEPLAQLKAGSYLSDVSRTFGINQTVLRRWADKHKIRVTSMPIDERATRVSAAKRALQREAGKHGHKGPAVRDYRPAHEPELRATVLKRLANGERVSAIAKDMGIPKPTAIRWSKQSGDGAADNEEG